MALIDMKWSLFQVQALVCPMLVLLCVHTATGTATSHLSMLEFRVLDTVHWVNPALLVCLHWHRNVRMGWMSGWSGYICTYQRKQPPGRGCCWTHGWDNIGGGSLEPGRKGCWLVLLGWEIHPAEHISWQGPWPRGEQVGMCPCGLIRVLEQYGTGFNQSKKLLKNCISL